MKQLTITEKFGQIIVTTADGQRAAGSSVSSAMQKLFPDLRFGELGIALRSLPDVQSASQIQQGQASA